MNVSELLTGLSLGNLRHLYSGLGGSGTIAEDDRSRIVFFANQALSLIYSRFSHNLTYVILTLSGDRQIYPIRPQNAVSNTDPENTEPRYLLDDPDEPFLGGLVKIRSVKLLQDPNNLDATEANLLLNNTALTGVVTTPSFDKLRFKAPVSGAQYELELQLKHQSLTLPAELTEEIILHPALDEALYAKVAAQVFATMTGEVNAAHAIRLENRFEELMGTITFEDLLQQTSTHEDDRLHENGWR